MANGMLYVVATPIGNMEDITLRAINTLKSVDMIAAEDTRHTIKLLNHLDIKNKLISFHEHSEMKKVNELINLLKNGNNIALVSDAGTPLISDPGANLVAEVVAQGLRVVPIPGASAVITALSVSGLLKDKFIFEGFLPTKNSERKAVLQSIKDEPRCVVLYEAPHRIEKTLMLLKEVLGEEREIVLAREMTKFYEEFLRGKIGDVIKKTAERHLKGEMVLIISGANLVKAQVTDEAIIEMLNVYIKNGATKKDAVKLTASSLDVLKNRVYQLSLTL